MTLFLPTKTREIKIEGEFKVEHPQTQRPIQCKGLNLAYNANETEATLTAVFTVHARSLRDIQAIFGVLPQDQELKLEMDPAVLQHYQAEFFAAEDESAFLRVGDAACFFLQNYHLKSE